MAKREDHDYIDAGNYNVDKPWGQIAIGGGGSMGPNILDQPYASGVAGRGAFDKISEEDQGRRMGMSIQGNRSRKDKKDDLMRKEIDRLIDRRG